MSAPQDPPSDLPPAWTPACCPMPTAAPTLVPLFLTATTGWEGPFGTDAPQTQSKADCRHCAPSACSPCPCTHFCTICKVLIPATNTNCASLVSVRWEQPKETPTQSTPHYASHASRPSFPQLLCVLVYLNCIVPQASAMMQAFSAVTRGNGLTQGPTSAAQSMVFPCPTFSLLTVQGICEVYVKYM